MKTLIAIFAAALIMINGCLTAEFKEISCQISEDGSGYGEIVYHNLLSQKYTDDDSPEEDFSELISQYIDGNVTEEEMPSIIIKSKKLFLENEKLNARIEFEFKNISDIKFFQYNSDSPIMYHISTVNETFVESNGFYNEEIMPVVFWERTIKNLKLKTSISGEIDPESNSFTSLKDEYLKWEAKKK